MSRVWEGGRSGTLSSRGEGRADFDSKSGRTILEGMPLTLSYTVEVLARAELSFVIRKYSSRMF
jgi:hypothetical protein